MGDLLSAKNLSNRVLLIVFVAFSVLTAYFIYTSYKSYLDESEQQVVERMYSIAQTASLQIDAEELSYLIETYTTKNAISSNQHDSIYNKIHKILANVATVNELGSPIYTLVKSDSGQYFEFIATSSANPYYRHSYKEFPDALLKLYDEGGKLDVHSSENGVWLSAFAPIKNTKGQTIAIIQADKNFEEFYAAAKSKLWRNILISLGIFIVILLILLRSLRALIKIEEDQKAELEHSYKLIAHKNKSIADSINYAKRIQDAMIPSKGDIASVFEQSYVFFRGKDVVSGDFPFMLTTETDGVVYIASVDCTGHGVPGALISIIGNSLLNDAIKNQRYEEPGDILKALHYGVVDALNQEQEGALTNDGMDIALLKVNKNKKLVQFAGAHRPLIHISGEEVNEIKGNRLSIGGTHYTSRGKKMDFSTIEINYTSGDSFHFFSDGFPDQFSDTTQKKFGGKNIREFYTKHCQLSLDKMGEELEATFDDWKGSHHQMDDVLVIGIKL